MILLSTLGSEKTKQAYLRLGAKEPVFGVAGKDLKPLYKRIKTNHQLALELYSTHHYDAMNLAKMIADPKIMSEEEFEDWISQAYCQGLSDYVVALTLAQSPLAQAIADRWIQSSNERCITAGWACYEWMLGSLKDEEFERRKLLEMLQKVEISIHKQPLSVAYAMNQFLIALGTSYLPLHEQALKTARLIGEIDVAMGISLPRTISAYKQIQKASDTDRLGYKRKSIRCY